jgi:hypothetical protein
LNWLHFRRALVPTSGRSESNENCRGIDHSAISVIARSIAFYEALGPHRSGGLENCGPEQSKLDDVPDAVVEVTALSLPQSSTPHVELLCYCGVFGIRVNEQAVNDVTATRLVFEVENAGQLATFCARYPTALSGPVRFSDGRSRAVLRDPDGHLICLETTDLAMCQPPVAKPGYSVMPPSTNKVAPVT